MRKIALSLLGAIAGAALLVGGFSDRVQLVEAADHGDGIDALNTMASDLTDNYAWVWDDAGTPSLALVMNVTGAEFANNVQYAWTLVRNPLGTPTVSQMICQFNSTTGDDVSCFFGDAADFTEASGDPSGATGFTENGIRVFAGERDDPFFFNVDGFAKTAEAVQGADLSGVLDANGCPDLDAVDHPNPALVGDETLRDAVANCLTTSCSEGFGGETPGVNDHDPAVNAFPGNVRSLVVSIPIDMIPGSTGFLGVSASTHVAP